MALRRAEEAELEPKKDRLVQVRMGKEAYDVLRQAADLRGLSMSHYARDKVLRAALADLKAFTDNGDAG